MPTSIDNAFEQQWSYEVKQDYQQKTAKIRACVRVQTGVVGESYNFQRLDSIEANTKARNAELTFIDIEHSVATANLTDHYAPILLDKLDEIKVRADFRREYVQSASQALARQTDDLIITALDAVTTSGGSPEDTGRLVSGSGAFTFERTVEAARLLNLEDVPVDQRALIISPQALDAALRETEFTSSDFMTLKSLITGEMSTALGFKWVWSTRLNTTSVGSPAATVRQCYAFDKRAVGLAIGQEITTELNYIPERVSHLANAYLSMGSVVIDPQGVVRYLITE